jgi:general secretion pathway protein D
MNRILNCIFIGYSLFILTACSIVDNKARPNTKKYLISNIDNKLSNSSEEKISYIEESYNNKMDDDLSHYVALNSQQNIEEITNLKSLKHSSETFNSDLMVIKKYFDKSAVKLSIEEMPLNKFLHLLLAKVLKVDYVLDKNIQGNTQPISINIKEKITKEKLFSIVSNILDGFNIVIDVESDIFYVKESSNKRGELVHKVYFGESIPPGVLDDDIIYIMRPFYYNKQISKHNVFIKKYFLSNKATLSIDDYSNIIKIKDKAKNIKKALEFYDFVDQPSMKNKHMKLVRMKNMDVEKFITQVTPIIKNYGILISKNPHSSGVQFVPIKQINSFLLLGDKESWLKTVLFWKNKLDIIEKSTEEDRGFFVYKPLNRKAEELVNIIQNFTNIYQSDNNISGSSNQSKKSVSSDKKMKVVLDKERNNIIIHSTKKQFYNVKKMLTSLDILPKQVLIEVTIADITLTGSLKFGLEWFIKNSSSKYGYSLQAFDQKGGLGGGGILGEIFSVSGNVGATLSALQTQSYVNILSNPKLLVLNNHSANINVGNQIPILTSQVSAGDVSTSSTTPSVLQNIQYQNTGINLTVKPTINSDGYLTLHISQNVSSATQNTISSISSPIIFNRSLQTDVVLKTGNTVILGGLISETDKNDESKIPFLGDIPILKKLFSVSGDSKDKSELVILIKATILSNNQDANIITDALLDLMNFD